MRNLDNINQTPEKEQLLKKLTILFRGQEIEVLDYPGQTVVVADYPYLTEYEDENLRTVTPPQQFNDDLYDQIGTVAWKRSAYRRGDTPIPGCVEIRTSDAEKIYLIPKDQKASVGPSGVELNNAALESKLAKHLKNDPRSIRDVAAAHVLSGETANVALTLAGVKPISEFFVPDELESTTPFCPNQIKYSGVELEDLIQHDIPGIRALSFGEKEKRSIFLIHDQALKEVLEKNSHIFRRAGLPCRKHDASSPLSKDEVDRFFSELIENFSNIMEKTPEVFGLLFGFDGRSVFQYRKRDYEREEWKRPPQHPSLYGPHYRIWDPSNNKEFQALSGKMKRLQAHIEQALNHATPFEVMQQLPAFYIQDATSQEACTVSETA
ncbi:hypothetical protein CO046_02445 [Candidatus Peregrinibacteria bacterium CG_4_9_14_0_2_um_filter_53_11]|nr:MAG: hypothetical protein CO046_02445 [Candidatus Peregrinibacteria bacterium CG_4_9_14_0_2_um_filter_53_11]